ncbi:MAG: hypothetical protein WC399_04415 [Bacilli bacterium]|jgi:hypothetical protein
MDESWFADEKKLAGVVNFKRALVFIAFRRKGRLTASVKSFTGLATLGHLNIKERQRHHLSAAAEDGRVKLVAVTKDREVIVLSETGNESGKVVYFDPGWYRIRAIGLKASFHMTLGLQDIEPKKG